MHIIIITIICLLSLVIGIFLLISEANGVGSKVRDFISTSIFGTESITALVGSLLSLKNLLFKSRLEILDELYIKERDLNIRRNSHHWKIQDFKVIQSEMECFKRWVIQNKIKVVNEIIQKIKKSHINLKNKKSEDGRPHEIDEIEGLKKKVYNEIDALDDKELKKKFKEEFVEELRKWIEMMKWIENRPKDVTDNKAANKNQNTNKINAMDDKEINKNSQNEQNTNEKINKNSQNEQSTNEEINKHSQNDQNTNEEINKHSQYDQNTNEEINKNSQNEQNINKTNATSDKEIDKLLKE
ncbi:10596_t:CDS:2 [Cetraspora pellucida]|uniref:10596_t:CDS:1 n=1 Tax=Cetraspora pellucida TaxID=1433469 RepID=A0A9N9NPM8_9GLOM|nr:10596_t:CDS:2 [Cetraspora pellucida]